MKPEKPKLILAGAGSGKTTRLVEEILKCIPHLEPYRYLVAITYTNAATNSIKDKLNSKVKIPPNLFVGTTYSFFNKFIILPYSSIIPKITNSKDKTSPSESFISPEKIFFEMSDAVLTAYLKRKNDNWNTFDPIQKTRHKNYLISTIVTKGKIPFDMIESISANLITNNPIIREYLGRRIQFLFVDEFQDSSNQQFQVFDEIRKSKRTEIYKVGDAEQFITNYSANFKEFNKIPIIHHQSKYQVQNENTNNRCSSQITQFINNFNTQLQQEARFSTIVRQGVFFVQQTDLSLIIKSFQGNTIHWTTEENFCRFYLAYENKTFDSVGEKFGISKISREGSKPQFLITEMMELICKVTNLSQKQICEVHKINLLQMRILAIRLLKKRFSSLEEFKLFFESDLNLKIRNDFVDLNKFVGELGLLYHEKNEVLSNDFMSSIHKSKGLEATCVLVVATNNKELKQWLETDKYERTREQYNRKMKVKAFEDTHRLGFVAFSRAKMSLTISCLEPLSIENRIKLQSLSVTFY